MEGIAHARTPEQVFNDFKGRRIGLIKALTTGIIFGILLYGWFSPTHV